MPLLTARAAAERLGVGYSTFKRWVRNGKVRTVRTEGGHHRVAEAEIDRLWGFIDEVRVDGLLAQVRLRVGNQTLTAVITADAVRALKLRRGDDAIAIIKSTEVMIARPGKAAKRG